MMRMAVAAFVVMLVGCSSPAPAPPPVQKPAPVKPADESRRFPKKDLKESTIEDDHVMGHAFLPGGNVAAYSRGGKTYRLFLVKLADSTSAGIALLDYKNALKDPKFIAGFGGYFGDDGGTPVFVFTKNEWILGIAGLGQAEADTVAREFAGRV